jgi:hypothetical protein
VPPDAQDAFGCSSRRPPGSPPPVCGHAPRASSLARAERPARHRARQRADAAPRGAPRQTGIVERRRPAHRVRRRGRRGRRGGEARQGEEGANLLWAREPSLAAPPGARRGRAPRRRRGRGARGRAGGTPPPPLVLSGHVSSFPRTNRARLVPPPVLIGLSYGRAGGGAAAREAAGRSLAALQGAQGPRGTPPRHGAHRRLRPRRPPPVVRPSRTNWTRLVPPSVLIGHVAYLLTAAPRRAALHPASAVVSDVRRADVGEKGRGGCERMLPAAPALRLRPKPRNLPRSPQRAGRAPLPRRALTRAARAQGAAAGARGRVGVGAVPGRRGRQPTSPPPRTNRTRRGPHPVLIGHAASLTPY